MPYLSDAEKHYLEQGHEPTTPGQLAYVIQQAVMTYLYREPITYSRIASVLGVIEGAKLDLTLHLAEVLARTLA